MKKAFLFGAMGMLLVVGFIFILANYGQAGTTDIKTSLDVSKGTNLTLGTKTVAYNTIWETYKPIEVKSVKDEVLFKGAITEHTAQCGSDCYSVVEIYKATDGVLIDDLYLNDEQGNRLDIKPNIEISNSYRDVEIIDYKEECKTTELKNGTKINECEKVISGSHFIKEPIYEKYTLGSSVKAGNYLIKPSAIFEITWETKTYDWIMVVDGKTLSEWATWDSGLTSGLISYYKFNGDYLDSINVSSPLTNSGTVNDSGILGSSINTTGGNYAYRTFGAIPVGTNALTVCLWDYQDPATTNNCMFGMGAFGDGGFGFALCTDALKYGITGFYHDVYSGSTFSTGQWNYVCGVQVNGNARRLYVNGANPANGSDTYNIGTTYQPRIGSFEQNPQNHRGRIDEVGIWNRALTSIEITQLYNSGVGITYPVASPCVFNGSVKYSNGTGVNGARVVITNINSDTVFGNVTADANGLWNKSVSTNGNYTVYAYINGNKTGGDDIFSYVECIQAES